MVLAVVVPAITPLYMFFSLFKVNARFGFNDAMFLKLGAALIRSVIQIWTPNPVQSLLKLSFPCARSLDEVRVTLN